MIRLLTLEKRVQLKSHVFLFQSRFFEKEFPPEVREFENLILVEAVGRDRDASLMKMREAMIGSHDFAAGIFIGVWRALKRSTNFFGGCIRRNRHFQLHRQEPQPESCSITLNITDRSCSTICAIYIYFEGFWASKNNESISRH